MILESERSDSNQWRNELFINCAIDKYIYRNKRSGESVFTVIPDGINAFREQLTVFGNLQCRGFVPELPSMFPVRLNVCKGKDGYDVWDIMPFAYSEEAVINFLSSGYFKGYGVKKAENTVKSLGKDIFDDGYGDAYIRERLSGILEYGKLSELILSIGGSYRDADRYYSEHKSFKDIQSDPYSLCEVLDFRSVDRLAKKMDTDIFSWHRYTAIIDSVLKSAESSGSTCIELQRLYGYAKRYDERIDPIYLMTVLLSESESGGRYVIVDEELLFRREMFEYEKGVESAILEIVARSKTYSEFDSSLIDEVEAEKGIIYSDKQKEAISLSNSSGIKVITGGPGTGKTTIIDGIISVFGKMFPDKSIMLAAPTANAAKRMREKTGCSAMTVHKMLGIRPFKNGKELDFKHIDADLVIIDEGGFVDIRLGYVLMQAVKRTATIIFVGDADQLPSVGPGNFFLDMIRSGQLPVCVLDRIYRQGGASNIVINAENIKNGNTAIYEGDDFEVIRVKDEDDKTSFADRIVNVFKEYYEKDSPFSVRLYSPIKKREYMVGTRCLNDRFQEIYKDSDKSITFGLTKYYVGDPVIFTRNNYDVGYCNGDEGVITEISSDSMTIKTDDGYIDINDFEDVELAYAITTHKSQGSECDIGVVVIPSAPASMLNRNMIYVATTRARKKTVVITEGRSLETAIVNRYKNKRITGLFYKVKREA